MDQKLPEAPDFGLAAQMPRDEQTDYFTSLAGKYAGTPLDGIFGDDAIGTDRPQTLRGKKLFVAVEAGVIGAVKAILQDPQISKDDLNLADPREGNTPLCEAVGEGMFEITKLLLEAGANIEYHNRLKYTPLHLASFYGHHEIAEELLKHGARVNAKNQMGETPLVLASYYSRLGVVKVLLQHDADVSIPDWRGKRALDVAKDDCKKILQEKLAEQERAKSRHKKKFASAQKKKGGSLHPKAVRRECVSECAVDNCHKTEKLKRCAKCFLVAYCTRDHQKSDWKVHKHWCLYVGDIRETLQTLCNSSEHHQYRIGALEKLKEAEPDLILAVNGAKKLVAAIKEEKSPFLVAPQSVMTFCSLGESNGDDMDEITALKFLHCGFWSAAVDIVRPHVFEDESLKNLFRGMAKFLKMKSVVDWIVRNEFNTKEKVQKFCEFGNLLVMKIDTVFTLSVVMLVVFSIYDDKCVKSGMKEIVKASLHSPAIYDDMEAHKNEWTDDVPWLNSI